MDGSTNAPPTKGKKKMSFRTLVNLQKIRSEIINSLSSPKKRLSSEDCTDNDIALTPLSALPSNVAFDTKADLQNSNNNTAKLSEAIPPTDSDESTDLAVKHFRTWKKIAQNKVNLDKSVAPCLEDFHMASLDRRRSSVTLSEVFTKTRRFSCNLDSISSQFSTSSYDLESQNVQELQKERRGSLLVPSVKSDLTNIRGSKFNPAKIPTDGQTIAPRRPSDGHFTTLSSTDKENATNSSIMSIRVPGNKTTTPGGNKVHHPTPSLPALRPQRLTKVTHHLHREQSSSWKQSVRINSKLQRYLQEKKSSYSTDKLKRIQECRVEQATGPRTMLI